MKLFHSKKIVQSRLAEFFRLLKSLAGTMRNLSPFSISQKQHTPPENFPARRFRSEMPNFYFPFSVSSWKCIAGNYFLLFPAGNEPFFYPVLCFLSVLPCGIFPRQKSRSAPLNHAARPTHVKKSHTHSSPHTFPNKLSLKNYAILSAGDFMDYAKLREEPLKSKIREDFFQKYKYTQLGNIDFVIAKHITEKGLLSLFEAAENDDLKSLLWAEAKQGTSHDIYESFVQLILTIGKEKTFEKYLPPKFIGAFDAEKFAFINYHDIQSVFYQNDFNWNVTPSNHDTKEFKQLHSLCENLLKENSILFRYGTQSAELKEFIRLNFKTDKEASEKISVTKNNFTFVFQKWSESVKPTIKVDWERAKKAGIISADFFLADLLSENGESLKDSLYVVLKNTKYELAKRIDELGMSVGFSDRQKAYKEF